MGGANDSGGDGKGATAPTLASSPNAIGNTDPIRTDVTPDPMIGRLIADRYQVSGLLGRGGMGAVYLCEHVQLKKRMALKVLAEEFKRQPELIARFLKEARAAAQIGHPNIVDVFDLGELPDGGAYIAMAMLEGEDLQHEIHATGAMPFQRARAIIGQVCRALAAAHGKGIVHRDMKPANIFLAHDVDGNEQVKILDFGIAQVTEVGEGGAAKLTQTGAIVGTPAFMSPEQGRGLRTDHRTDIYSVGCILYNLLTGEVPFDGNTLMGVITKHLFDPPPAPSAKAPPGTVSLELDALVLRALAKEPAARFQTMKEMFVALEACSDTPADWPDAISGRFARTTPVPGALGAGATQVPSMSSGTGHTTPEVRPSSARGALLALGLLLGVGVAVGVVYLRRQVARSPSIVMAPAATKPSPTAPPAISDVTIEIRTSPPGASVSDGNERLGVTPLKLTRARSDKPLALSVQLAGAATESLSIALDRDQVIDVKLTSTALPQPLDPSLAAKTAAKANPGKPKTATSDPAAKKARQAGKGGDLKDPF